MQVYHLGLSILQLLILCALVDFEFLRPSLCTAESHFSDENQLWIGFSLGLVSPQQVLGQLYRTSLSSVCGVGLKTSLKAGAYCIKSTDHCISEPILPGGSSS